MATFDKTQGGHNLTKLKADITKAADTIEAAKLDRTSCNETIAAELADLATKGIHKDAMRMAMKYAEWDEDKREGFDIAYELTREALGRPFSPQGDLFGPDGEDKQEG